MWTDDQSRRPSPRPLRDNEFLFCFDFHARWVHPRSLPLRIPPLTKREGLGGLALGNRPGRHWLLLAQHPAGRSAARRRPGRLGTLHKGSLRCSAALPWESHRAGRVSGTHHCWAENRLWCPKSALIRIQSDRARVAAPATPRDRTCTHSVISSPSAATSYRIPYSRTQYLWNTDVQVKR